MRTVYRVLCVLGLALVLAGCSTANMVNLKYKPVSEAGTCNGSVTVIKFADARGKDMIGQKSDGTYYYSVQPVGEWVSKAFFEELKKTGCAMNWSEQDFNSDTEYKLTGTIKDIWLKESSLTDYSARMAVNVVLTRGGTKVYEENLYSNVSKTTTPGSSNSSDILQDALQDLIKTAMPAIKKRMGME
ncbi:putative lipoprotein [Desulfovibrio sp. X2]|uniref:hypothetical protein n=1 Tax=Desulfovibrio sp. X2 TaxID=941449 RepID=UPI000358F07E|nr:hypothetical protein [Desulfovibrio sp. X2]EPR37587.1 putative lipoprotein [Desulfovibrio sp. X2]